MSWLEFIGKILLIGFGSAVVIVIAIVVIAMVWLAYEQANGRNPFQ